jgi:hypothetical protein
MWASIVVDRAADARDDGAGALWLDAGGRFPCGVSVLVAARKPQRN